MGKEERQKFREDVMRHLETARVMLPPTGELKHYSEYLKVFEFENALDELIYLGENLEITDAAFWSALRDGAQRLKLPDQLEAITAKLPPKAE